MTQEFSVWFAALLDFWLTDSAPWRGTATELHSVLYGVAAAHDAGPDLLPRGAVLSRAVRLAGDALAEAGWRCTFSRTTGQRLISFAAIAQVDADDDLDAAALSRLADDGGPLAQ